MDGAVETLCEDILRKNESEKKIEIDCVTLRDKEARKNFNKYPSTHFYELDFCVGNFADHFIRCVNYISRKLFGINFRKAIREKQYEENMSFNEYDLIVFEGVNPFITENIFPGWEFKVVGNDFFIKPEDSESWDLLGCAMALSKSHQFKGSSYPNVSEIYFDEFMAEVGCRELKKEVNKLFNLIETVFRFRTPCVVLLGNATTFEGTQYKYELGLQAPYNSDVWFHPDKPIAVVMATNSRYIEKKKKSKFGKLVAGTSYETGMIDNKFYGDSSSFIKKKKGQYRFVFSFYYNGDIFGAFTNGKNVIIDKSNIKPDFQIYDPEMDKEARIIKKSHPTIRRLSKYAELGCLFYQNAQIKAKLHKLFLKIVFN